MMARVMMSLKRDPGYNSWNSSDYSGGGGGDCGSSDCGGGDGGGAW